MLIFFFIIVISHSPLFLEFSVAESNETTGLIATPMRDCNSETRIFLNIFRDLGAFLNVTFFLEFFLNLKHFFAMQGI